MGDGLYGEVIRPLLLPKATS